MATRATFQEVEGFVDEARAYLPTIRQQLETHGREGDRGNGCSESLDAAFLHVQALRGAASMIGLKSLSRLASGLESTLGQVRAGEAELDGDARSRVLKTLDDIALALAGFRLQARRVGHRRPRSEGAETDDEASELVEIFRLEAEEHFLELARHFALLRERPGDRLAWRQVQRRAHTLKGAAGTAGLHDISRLAHRMEDLLDAVLDRRLEPDAEKLQLVLRTTDALQALVYQDVAPENLGAQLEELETAYRRHLGEEAPVDEPRPAPAAAPATPGAKAPAAPSAGGALVRLPLERFETFQNLVGELILNRGGLEQHVRDLNVEIEECEAGVARLERLSARLEDEVTLGLPLAPAPAATAAVVRPPRGEPADDADGAFDELEMDRYSELDVLSRHLVEVAADLNTVAGDLRTLLRSFQSSVTRERGLARQLENRLTQARLVSFSTLAPRLQRAVRVTAARQEKLVDLVIRGQEVEIDKLVLEELAAPLQHLVRNAVDHGIEPPAARRAAGKPEAGHLEIRVAHHGRQVVIEIGDDGRGLDVEAIGRAAQRAGLHDAGELAGLSRREIWELIFIPGLTTARTVDEISGRGIGLDVVEATVRQLSGDVAVDSQPGRGVRFTLRLPLSLATDRVLLVKAAERTYAVPQAYAEQVVSLASDAVVRGEDSWYLRRSRGSSPLVALDDLLGFGAGEPRLDRGPPVTAFIVERGGESIAIAVDALAGSREVVVKPLSGHLRQVRGVVGATLLGGGELVLILNPVELVAAHERPAERRRPARRRPALPALQPPAATTIFVVDDSLSIRRAVADSIEAAGWRPVTARDGQEALELLQQSPTPPGAIVVDLEMPRMDGFELTATLRAIDEYARIPVIVLTSRASDKHQRRALELGAADYLVKPYQEDVLLRSIRSVLGSAEE